MKGKRLSFSREGCIQHQSTSAGFTLMEILIVVAILMILLLFVLVNWKSSIDKSHDSQRKSDLAKIRTAYEEYYNDRECYPEITILNACEGAQLSPYMDAVPCDPVNREPYTYVAGDDGGTCAGYRICAKLANKSDPDIIAQGCHPDHGCGWGLGINYCLTSGFLSTAPGFNPDVPPSPTPSPTPYYEGNYACTPGGDCNGYDDPSLHGCPRGWSDPQCQGMCGNPAMRCTD